MLEIKELTKTYSSGVQALRETLSIYPTGCLASSDLAISLRTLRMDFMDGLHWSFPMLDSFSAAC
jgi:hypothetical protein